ncbi:hypothetical protein K443DRAFT_100250 [Laccaria amethystina LaAM-08-1]|uniref:Uncharacterized protein n=1 Tax=Laccaria amethystina LaAM-08-1 TaxID=1095629 RepID=A0A0C9XFW6_9AGAR|nr:hypothetical protein K443DRAFT_100250 [Laccaria amethystina LaAM-08-1]
MATVQQAPAMSTAHRDDRPSLQPSTTSMSLPRSLPPFVMTTAHDDGRARMMEKGGQQ